MTVALSVRRIVARVFTIRGAKAFGAAPRHDGSLTCSQREAITPHSLPARQALRSYRGLFVFGPHLPAPQATISVGVWE